MVKLFRKCLLSRRKFITLGIGSIATMVTIELSKLKAVSYLIYPFKQDRHKIIDPQARKFTVAGKKSLKYRAKAKGIIYGAFPQADDRDFRSSPNLQSSLIRECATMTMGAYWITTRPTVDTFDFTSTDYFAQFAAKNKLLLRGHPLIWHEAFPKWFTGTINRQNAEQLLTEHIKTVVERYRGKIHSWDVVNEAVDVGDRRSDGLRKTPWLEHLGEDYLDLAFRLAAQADPQAKLVYNEFGVEYDTPGDAGKREAVLRLLQRLKSQGTPIYALGIQSHLDGDRDNFNASKFRNFLKSVASLGLKIMITELDVSDYKLPLGIDRRDRMIAAAYEDYLTVALAEPAVISVTTWGLSDRFTWLSGFRPRADRAEVRPLPFDRNFKPKLAWNAIARAFDRAPKR